MITGVRCVRHGRHGVTSIGHASIQFPPFCWLQLRLWLWLWPASADLSPSALLHRWLPRWFYLEENLGFGGHCYILWGGTWSSWAEMIFEAGPPVALAPLGTLSQNKKYEDKDPAPGATFCHSLPVIVSAERAHDSAGLVHDCMFLHCQSNVQSVAEWR